jgi:micrococcal nuclease
VAASLAFAGAAWLAACLCSAQACDVSDAGAATIDSVIDGETLRLTDGRTVRLIGAKALRPRVGWRGEDPWPFVEEAQAGLADLTAGKQCGTGLR